MTTPPELSEAHLQDHEIISAALEASSLSPGPSSSALPPFLTSTTPGHPTTFEARQAPLDASHSPPDPSPDLLTTPRTDSSRILASPPTTASPPLNSSTTEPRNSVKFTLLKKDPIRDANERERDNGDAGAENESLESFNGNSIRVRDEGGAEADDGEQRDEDSALDPVLLAALNHHRDRFLLLRAEVELERFLANPSMTRLPLAPPYFQPALNSYQRLLVHRLADTFGITREVEAAPPTIWNAGAINPATGQPQGVVVLVKGDNTRLPPAKLATYAPAPELPAASIPSAIVVPSPSSTPSISSSPITSAGPSASTSSLPNLVDSSSNPTLQPTAPQILKILPRSSASRTASSASSSIGTDEDPATSSSAPPSAKGKGRRELTLEEREAAYKEARERIFSQPEQERSTPAVLSSSEDIASKLASAGAGITRPSSAGSTFSRSSAALWVAGGRPSPSVASESGSSMWSGHHGGIYGGGSQLMPSLRPSAATFDPGLATAGWTQEYGMHQQYPQEAPSWQHQQYPPPAQYPHPPIQVTAPPAHSPYAANSPAYASSSTCSIPGPVPPPPFQPPSHPQYVQVDGWGRNVPPPLPSPSLSNSSGSSMQQRLPTQHHASSPAVPTSERNPGASSGYLMRFADTGAVVSPGGTVTPGPAPTFPSPSSSIFAGPPSTSRSVSSFSSTSQHSHSSGGGGGVLRTAASSTGSGGGGGSASRSSNTGSQARRASGSLASSMSSARSTGERIPSAAGEGEGRSGSPTDFKKRDRQTTIRRPSSGSLEPETGHDELSKTGTNEENSPLHPSLPAKPIWVASKAPRPRSPPPTAHPTSALDGSDRLSRPSSTFASPSPGPPAAYPSSSSTLPPLDNNPRHYQVPFPHHPLSTSNPPPSFYSHSQSPQSFANGSAPPAPPQQGLINPDWNRPSGGQHYPAAPTFAVSNGGPGQYLVGGAGGGGPGAANFAPNSLPPPNWGYAQHHSVSLSIPTAPNQQMSSNPRASPQDAMPFPDIRRPPPKSTQLFDPNRPSGGGAGAGAGAGMRRGASGTGSIRSASGTRGTLE